MTYLNIYTQKPYIWQWGVCILTFRCCQTSNIPFLIWRSDINILTSSKGPPLGHRWPHWWPAGHPLCSRREPSWHQCEDRWNWQQTAGHHLATLPMACLHPRLQQAALPEEAESKFWNLSNFWFVYSEDDCAFNPTWIFLCAACFPSEPWNWVSFFPQPTVMNFPATCRHIQQLATDIKIFWETVWMRINLKSVYLHQSHPDGFPPQWWAQSLWSSWWSFPDL